ncbi:LytTR family DNA-binding domain-containing protein [Sphingobacterium sp. DR205]|uniref:LytR/AlgR family response regulator transcription factor n=1 Tax=Sphingobacterium sp. DR205 TaxID=2713573 RepID=UPI002407E6F2|nr:LytTR family DNA-binding domain-containing protein [Sphingobacterium sp. DR205]
MHRVNTIIIEDEPLARKRLEGMVAKIGQLELLGSYEDPIDAKEILKSGNVDLMLSDIQMPEMDGVSFLRSLPNPPFVIFITAHREFASEGFELDVLDYILKPLLTQERLLKAIDKVQNALVLRRNTPKNQVLKFKDAQKTIFINPADIYYIKAFGDYATVITEKETFTISSTLKELEKKLSWNMFVRIHRSHIVKIDQIKSVDAVRVILKNNEKLDIGLKYRSNLYNRMGLKID